MPSTQLERKFASAVNVIRGLPKNGSYQPSNDMMLRFYSYFKQATLGPCTQKRPPFWDVVNKAKYDSYKALGHMPKERAMELYVEELKKIIETMSYTDNVAEFMESIGDLNGIDVDDLEIVAPKAILNVQSNSHSFASREASQVLEAPLGNGYTNGVNIGQEYSVVNGNSKTQESFQNGHSNEQHSDDEYIDTVEDDVYLLREPVMQNRISRPTTRRPIDEIELQRREITSTSTNYKQIEPAINQILRTVESMRNDLQQINNRIDIVERSMTEVKNHQLRKKIMALRYPNWWPFSDISPNWFFILILWPFVARHLAYVLRKKSK